MTFKELLASNRRRYKKDCSLCGEHLIYFHKNKDFGKPEVCPNCGSSDWDKPIIEIELFALQELYSAETDMDKKKKHLSNMYIKLIEYSENMIKSMLKAKIILSKEELESKSHDAAAITLQRFLENPEYTIKSSFGGNLKRILQGVLYGDQKNDCILSLDYSKNGESDFGDFVSDDTHYACEDTYEEDPIYDNKVVMKDDGLVADISKITEQFSDALRFKDPAGSILFLAGIYSLFLKKNKQSMSLFYQISGSEIKKSMDNFQIYLRNYLKNNLGDLPHETRT